MSELNNPPDNRYVNVTGDTMTGTLQINVPTTTTEALILKSTDDNATKNIFEAFKADGTTYLASLTGDGDMGVGEESPASRFHVSGKTADDYAQFDYGINLNPVKEPDVLVLVLAAGTDLEIAVYYYMVQYVTDLGVTNFSPIDIGTFGTGITTTAGNQNVTITVPVSSDYRVTGRKIWRSGPTTSYVKWLVTEINDNTTTTFLDDISDAILVTGTSWTGYSDNTTAKPITINGLLSLNLQYANTMVGIGAGKDLVEGAGRNVFVGALAGQNVTTGNENVLVGQNAGSGITTGGTNIGIGTSSCSGNGSSNVGIGYVATRDGNFNVGVGAYALAEVSAATPSYNTALGYFAGRYNEGLYNVFIGYRAGSQHTTGDKKLYIASSDTTTPLIYGEFDGGVTIHSQATTAVALTVKGIASQTANLTELRNSSNAIRRAFNATGIDILIADQTTDTAPNDDTTLKKLSLQKLASPPTNGAYIAFANNPGTDIFYLVLEEG